MSAWGMSDPSGGILPTTPPPPPPPDLHAALDQIDTKRVVSLLPDDLDQLSTLARLNIVKAVIAAIREQLPPPVTR